MNCFFRALVLEEAADDPDFQTDLWILCSRDILFWVNTFMWTDDAELIGEQEVPFIAYPKQNEAIFDMYDSVLARCSHGVNKARRVGFSWQGMGLAAWIWQFMPSSRGLVGSRTEEDVDNPGDPKSLFWKIDFILAHEPTWLRPEMGRDDRMSRRFLNPENKATITGSTTQKDIGRGGGYTYIWIDEASSIEVLADAMDSINHASKCRFMVSTPKGASGPFYEAYNNCKKQTTCPWWEFPPQAAGLYRKVNGKLEILDKDYVFPEGYEFVDDGKLRSPYFDDKWNEAKNPKKIAQEMECEFLGSGYEWFPKQLIERLLETTARPPVWEGDLMFDQDSLDPIRLVRRENGPLKLWIYPDFNDLIPASGRYVMGSDISAGTGASDSTNTVLDLYTGEKVAEYVTCTMPPEKFARLSIAMTKLFKGSGVSCLHAWDAGGHGHPYRIEMVERGTGNFWYNRQEKRVDRRVSSDPGIYMNGKDVRRMMFDSYRAALDEGKFINRSADALRECMCFEETPDGRIRHKASDTEDPSGAGENHGDRTIADIIAWWIARDNEQEPEKAEPRRPDSCMGRRFEDRKRELEMAVAW